MKTDMEDGQTSKRSNKRLPFILSLVFIVIVVIVGAVTWKLTRDAYDESDNDEDDRNAEKDKTNRTSSSTFISDTATTERTYTEQDLKEKPWLRLRMTRDVLPVHYDITIYPDFYEDHGEFYGNETIELDVQNATRFILIHVHTTYMNITDVTLTNDTGAVISISRTFDYLPNEYFVMETEETIQPSTIYVKLGFQGSLIRDIKGLYKSSYIDTRTNKTRVLATSKFEPTFARRAFPCFDEPNIKAEYTITLIHREEYVALSNMPDVKTEILPWSKDLVYTKFARSVKMSTYLVCFIVCDFKSKQVKSIGNIPIRVFATPDKIDQVDFALYETNHTLYLYVDKFEMKYPLPKLDLIAIPDFVSGAMEHWGLISFRETRLLVDESKASLRSKETVAHVVAHEMAHQWFGNMVTMEWWNDLWLNEGFASYIEYIGADSYKPDWGLIDKFLIEDLFSVMGQDAKLSSHPIVVDVQDPNNINSVFDAISYSKGSSVIRMLKAILGSDIFFKGVAAYLKKYQWANARTDNLWECLSEATDHKVDVKHIMDSWTLQDGFPYIRIDLNDTGNGNTTITATQKRFLLNSQAKVDPNTSIFGYKWYVQLDYFTSTKEENKFILDFKESGNFQINMIFSGKENWIKFNRDQTGYYRVLYPDILWEQFSQHLKQPEEEWKLGVADRAGLLNDAFRFASAEMIGYEIPLELTSYLVKEKHLVPWSAASSGGISFITSMLKDDADFSYWRDFFMELIETSLQNLGAMGTDTHVQKNLRVLLISYACYLGDASTLRMISEKYDDWIHGGNNKVDVNLRSLVYSYGMAYRGTEDDWNTVLSRYQLESSPAEKSLLAKSLTKVRIPHLIAKLLDFCMNRPDIIKSQDFFSFMSNLEGNDVARHVLWDWVRANYQALTDRFTVGNRYFGRLVYNLASGFKTEFKLQEVKDLFKEFPEAGAGERYRRLTIESIEKNIHWMNNIKPTIINWLKQRQRV